jgi:hypothetical protein
VPHFWGQSQGRPQNKNTKKVKAFTFLVFLPFTAWHATVALNHNLVAGLIPKLGSRHFVFVLFSVRIKVGSNGVAEGHQEWVRAEIVVY